MTRSRRFGPPGTPLVKHRKLLAIALTSGLAVVAPCQAQQNPAGVKPTPAPSAPAAQQPVPVAQQPAPAAPAKPPAQARGPAKPAAAPAKLDRAEAIKRANGFFNASPVLTA